MPHYHNEKFTPIGCRLKSIRKLKKLFQYDVAERLSISQKNVCEIEKREDLYISTLKKYVEALGGTLKVIVEFNEHEERIEIGNSIKT